MKPLVTHKLKIKKVYLDNILAKRKKSEVRLNDRDFQVGDIVELYEYEKLGATKNIKDCDIASYSYQICHIHSGLGMENNYVILSWK